MRDQAILQPVPSGYFSGAGTWRTFAACYNISRTHTEALVYVAKHFSMLRVYTWALSGTGRGTTRCGRKHTLCRGYLPVNNPTPSLQAEAASQYLLWAYIHDRSAADHPGPPVQVFNRVMAILCDMAASNSALFTLQERSSIAAALIQLRSEGQGASGPVASVLASAPSQLTAAATSGRQGSLDAAQHVPALLSLLAEYHSDVMPEHSESVASAAMRLVDAAARRLKPGCLAATLCASAACPPTLATRNA